MWGITGVAQSDATTLLVNQRKDDYVMRVDLDAEAAKIAMAVIFVIGRD